MSNTKPHYHVPPYHRRLLCEALEARTLLSVGLAQASSSAAQQQTLADLPVAAQHAISSAIGQDQSAYHAASAAAGVTLANPANGFTAQVKSGALQVSAGSNTWDMSLTGLGYDGAVQPVGTAMTTSNGNRVDCNYGTVDEWYVNGPSGLEQGFTVAPPPRSNPSGSLTVELALGGDLVGKVNAAGDGLTLARPDGSAALGYTGLTACDATGKMLPASLEVRADGGRQELLIHVSDAGTHGPITIDPFVQEAELTASDGAPQDLFGSSVSISGNTMVVGAPSVTVGEAQYQGVAYVFTESGSVWTQTAKLTESNGYTGDSFGDSVSISGNTVVVGADEGISQSNWGAAYVFTEPASGWADMTQTAKLLPSDGPGYYLFGCSVSISCNTVVVGASNHNAAYVFVEPASGWAGHMTQTAKLTLSGAAGVIGDSVSISGNTVVVGASYYKAAYIFTEPASGWADMTQTATLTPSDAGVNDRFGSSVSISGNTVVVGAFQANVGQGAFYVFTEPASGWADMTQTATLTPSDGGGLFCSVSISGSTIVAGTSYNASQQQGTAYVFAEPASGWANMTQTGEIVPSDGRLNDYFGCSVSISGNTVVVGAYGVNGYTGAAYVFAPPPPAPLTVSPTAWTSAGLTLTLGSDGNLHVYTTGTTSPQLVPPVAPASVSNIEITSPSDTTASLTIDSTNGDPVPDGSLSYSGAGGLVITGSGTVTLSGTNTYTGGTTVSAGTLRINAASALPTGTSLTVGAGGTFIFDPSVIGGSTVTSAANSGATVPVASSGATVPVASAGETPAPQVDSSSQAPSAAMAVNCAVGTSGRAPAQLGHKRRPAIAYVGNLAWLTQAVNSSGTPDQQRKKEVAILAREAVFAQTTDDRRFLCFFR